MISEYNVNGIENKFKSAWKRQIQREELNNVILKFQERISWTFESNVPNEWFHSQDALYMHDCDGCEERILSWNWIANKMLDAKVVVCWELCEAYLINLPGSNDRSHLFTSSIKVARSAQQNWEKTKTKLMAINLHKSLVKGTVSDAHTFWFLHTHAHAHTHNTHL